MPAAEAKEAFRHVLKLLVRACAERHDIREITRRISRIRTDIDRATLTEDYQEVCGDICQLALDAGAPIERADDESRRLLRECIAAAQPIAQALGMDAADLGLSRLRQSLDESMEPKAVADALHSQLEKLAAGASWLKHTCHLLKDAVGDVLGTLGPLLDHEPLARHRLERVRTRLQDAEALDDLQQLRELLLAETEALVAHVMTSTHGIRQTQAAAQRAEVDLARLQSVLDDATSVVEIDPLTGVGNQRALQRSAQTFARSSHTTGIVCLELDRWQSLKATHGPATAGSALRHLAERLEFHLGAHAAVFRVAEDRFLVLMDKSPLLRAKHQIEHIQRALLTEPVAMNGTPLTLSLSAGISLWHDGEAFETARGHAEQALQEALMLGPNQVMTATNS